MDMEYLYVALIGLLVAILSLQMAWRLDFGPISAWDNYKKHQSKASDLELRRQELYPLLRTILWLKISLEVAFLLFLLQQLDLAWWGRILGLVILLLMSVILAKTSLAAVYVQRIYQKFEVKILQQLRIFKCLKLPMFEDLKLKPLGLSSRQEFEFLVENDQRIFSDKERQIIQAAPKFLKQQAKDLLISLEEMPSVKAKDLLGLLEINRLYETGEKLFVVKTKDRVIGLISLDDITKISGGQTFRAEQLARRDYLEVEQNAPLVAVISKMLEQNAQVALVGDETRILGIIKLETILKQLKITVL